MGLIDERIKAAKDGEVCTFPMANGDLILICQTSIACPEQYNVIFVSNEAYDVRRYYVRERGGQVTVKTVQDFRIENPIFVGWLDDYKGMTVIEIALGAIKQYQKKCVAACSD